MRIARVGIILMLLAVGAPAVWGQTGTTSTTTLPTTTVVFADCFGPGGVLIPCPSTTTTSTALVSPIPPLGSFVCSLLSSLDTFFGALLRDILQPIRQFFGCAAG